MVLVSCQLHLRRVNTQCPGNGSRVITGEREWRTEVEEKGREAGS